jgi:hypothetical protein
LLAARKTSGALAGIHLRGVVLRAYGYKCAAMLPFKLLLLTDQPP